MFKLFPRLLQSFPRLLQSVYQYCVVDTDYRKETVYCIHKLLLVQCVGGGVTNTVNCSIVEEGKSTTVRDHHPYHFTVDWSNMYTGI